MLNFFRSNQWWFQPECQLQPTFSDFSGDMSVDFAQSYDNSYLGLLNDCGVPLSHVISPVRDDRDLEHELECYRDANSIMRIIVIRIIHVVVRIQTV